MKRSEAGAIEIGGAVCEPGQRLRVEIPVARLTTGEWLHLPVEVVNGERSGPGLWLSGAIHGDELDGIEITRRVLASIKPEKLTGSVIGVPVVNLFGVVTESRYLPDRRDLNRSFPGAARGSLAARLAHLFLREVVQRCEFGIDFHCGSDDRENLPQVRANLDDEETRRLALAFGAPVTIHGTAPDGSLRKTAVANGARVLLYEGGEAQRFTAPAIELGVAGSQRVLAALGMVGDLGDVPAQNTLETRRTRWVRAGRSGICKLDVELGQHVRKNQQLGRISDALGDGSTRVRARCDGIIIGRRVHPLVYQGEAVAHIAEL